MEARQRHVALSSDKHTLVTGGNRMFVWNIESDGSGALKVIMRWELIGHRTSISCLSFIDDSTLISGSLDRARLWNVITLEALHFIPSHDHAPTCNGFPRSISCCPQLNRIAIDFEDDGIEVFVFESPSYCCTRVAGVEQFSGATRRMNGIVFSPQCNCVILLWFWSIKHLFHDVQLQGKSIRGMFSNSTRGMVGLSVGETAKYYFLKNKNVEKPTCFMSRV